MIVVNSFIRPSCARRRRFLPWIHSWTSSWPQRDASCGRCRWSSSCGPWRTIRTSWCWLRDSRIRRKSSFGCGGTQHRICGTKCASCCDAYQTNSFPSSEIVINSINITFNVNLYVPSSAIGQILLLQFFALIKYGCKITEKALTYHFGTTFRNGRKEEKEVQLSIFSWSFATGHIRLEKFRKHLCITSNTVKMFHMKIWML